MMIIHKIHVTSKMVRIGYIENIETAPRAYTLEIEAAGPKSKGGVA